ncbi:AbrB/MazE/SpoVT family DNA-binding domain-containing protein [Candidatus Pristimantibacillus sp. PTI5]|uniref:AbrB/MazE/SpoVT family DNA-binding domain-containing protein n=1 Tax=Candidatus Pristimantibacillus sp. PTI5 TaxID=3400422 RepID=UPI003B02A8E4
MDYTNGEDLILMTTATLSKWGNSSAVRIPSQFLKQLNLDEGAELQIILTANNEILLRPVTKPSETPEELRNHMRMLLSKIKLGSPRHEEIDLGIEGDELL